MRVRTTIMSTKSSQGERQWPSTQQMLLDHLRRIVEGVVCFAGDPDHGEPDKIWYFGAGTNCLHTCESGNEGEEDIIDRARIQLFLYALGVEARDRPSGVKKNHQNALKVLVECFEDSSNPWSFFGECFPRVLILKCCSKRMHSRC